MISVNLTTTYQRLHLCRIALTSLLLQTRLPDRIHLWVSRESYLRDRGIADTGALEELLDALPAAHRERVQIRWVSNTGPYRKLIPMLREAGAEDVLVTADDDIFYGRDWLKLLLKNFEQAGGQPVAARVRKKAFNFLGGKTSYLYWNVITEASVVADDFVITFGGGAVLTASMFRAEDIVSEAYLDMSPTADDLWYSRLLRNAGCRIVVVPEVLSELTFLAHKEGLGNQNNLNVRSLLTRIKFRLWDSFAGRLGLPISENDRAYRRLEKHFN